MHCCLWGKLTRTPSSASVNHHNPTVEVQSLEKIMFRMFAVPGIYWNHRHTLKCSLQPYNLQIFPLVLTELKSLNSHKLCMERSRESCWRKGKCIKHMHQFNALKWCDEYFIRLIYKCVQTPSVCIA